MDLKEHQQGKTDYSTSLAICANMGVEKWIIHVDKMTCTYYDVAGNEMHSEEIPQ